MHARFGYCFAAPPGSEYPPIVREHRMEAGRPSRSTGQGGPITALPILQEHGDITSLGFRFGAPGLFLRPSGLPADSVAALAGLDVWIVDALRDKPHPSHLSVAEALAWIERIKPKRAILTNLHTDLDYDELRSRLPRHVEPAYDGLSDRIARRVSSARHLRAFLSSLSCTLDSLIHKIFHNISYANYGCGQRQGRSQELWFRRGVDCHQGVRLARDASIPAPNDRRYSP